MGLENHATTTDVQVTANILGAVINGDKTCDLVMEKFLSAAGTVHAEIRTFLGGQADSRFYDPQSWSLGAQLPNSVDITAALACIAEQPVGRMLTGRLPTNKRDSYIPNVIGLYYEHNRPLAVKVGEAHRLFANYLALQKLQTIGKLPSHCHVSTVSLYYLDGTRIGMLTSPLVWGEPMDQTIWKQHTDVAKAIVQTMIDCWLDEYRKILIKADKVMLNQSEMCSAQKTFYLIVKIQLM